MDINSVECFALIFNIGEDKKYTGFEFTEKEDKRVILQLIQKRLKEESNVSQKI